MFTPTGTSPGSQESLGAPKKAPRGLLIGGVLLLLLIICGVWWLRSRSVDEVLMPPAPNGTSNQRQEAKTSELVNEGGVTQVPADDDGDLLPNSREQELGTDPKNVDTDGDGRSDGEEVFDSKTNPLVVDKAPPPPGYTPPQP